MFGGQDAPAEYKVLQRMRALTGATKGRYRRILHLPTTLMGGLTEAHSTSIYCSLRHIESKIATVTGDEKKKKIDNL